MIIHYLGFFFYEKFRFKSNTSKWKNKFLDEKHLDWYVATYIRNYPEFLEMDYQKAMDLAKQHFEDYEVLTQYIVDLNNAYISAKSYLGIDWKLLLYSHHCGMKFLFALVTQRWHKSFQVFDTERYSKAYCGGFFFACFLRNAEACILKILLKITYIIFSSTGEHSLQ